MAARKSAPSSKEIVVCLTLSMETDAPDVLAGTPDDDIISGRHGNDTAAMGRGRW